ncbi:MAG: signal recognition particle-docking protein FtsY [Thermoanaerobaculia bacterium]
MPDPPASGTIEPAPAKRKGLWGKLKKGLFMTHTELLERFDAALAGRVVLDEESLEELEEVLIGADLGVETSLALVEGVRTDMRREEAVDPLRLRQRLADEIAVLLEDAAAIPVETDEPTVTLLVGVNGVGKTTSAAKLVRWHQERDRRVLLAAADTFRAAAVEQLALWGERLGVDVIRQARGADPGAVVYDALQAARARRADRVIVDTAGRLHNKQHLMDELAKIRRVIDRQADGWRCETLLVLDATTGQNGLAQAEEFHKVAAADAVLLAKVDGTAKGGIVVAVARQLGLPVRFLGVGEGADDLVEFRPRDFATALLG